MSQANYTTCTVSMGPKLKWSNIVVNEDVTVSEDDGTEDTDEVEETETTDGD